MKKSLGMATKISIIAAICMFLVAAGNQTAFFFRFKGNMYDLQKKSLALQAKEEASTINEWLKGQEEIINCIGNTMEYNANTDHEYLMDYLGECLNDNEYALMYYICFAYDKSINAADHSKLDLDPTERDWWKAAIEKGDLIFTDPYTDFASGKMVVTLAKPLVIDGKEAVLLADITLDSLIDIINDSSINSGNEIFLLAKDASVVVHPNSDFLPKEDGNTILTDEFEFDLNASETQEIVDYDGVNKFLAIESIDETGWKIGALYRNSQINSILTATLRKSNIELWMLTIIFSIIVALTMKKMISPLTDAVACMDAISKGDFSVSIKKPKTKDEIGRLQVAAGHLLDTLSSMVNETNTVLGAIANQDLSIKDMSSYEGDFDLMSKSINQIKHTMSDLIKEIQTAATQVNAGASQLANAAENLSVKTMEQSNSIRLIEEHIGEIGNRIQYSSNKCREADVLLEDMDSNIQTGHGEMTKLMQLVADIEGYSSEIQKIVNVIDSISFQTNILALNASVEAARAGEAGKGFAVVSEEVRNLAYKSSDESKKTDEIIKNCIMAINAVKSAAEDTFACLEGVSKQSVTTRSAFHSIYEDTIALATNASDMVHEAKTVSNAVQANMATSEQTAASSVELSNQSESLEIMVGGFRV